MTAHRMGGGTSMLRDQNVKTRTSYSDDVSALLCPRCGGECLHHLGVTVFDRSEDASMLTKIGVNGSTVGIELVQSTQSGNPSNRRDGVVIRFSCEQCNWGGRTDVIELTIAQHKGTTEVGWRFDPLK